MGTVLCVLSLLFIGFSVDVLTRCSASDDVKYSFVEYDLNKAEEYFQDFIKTFNKEYKTEEEYKYRLKLFGGNLKKINEFNKAHQGSAVFAVNIFSDLTWDETKKYKGFKSDNITGICLNEYTKYVPKGNAPDSLDYRTMGYVTEVKEQKDCGSCYVFSAIGAIEGQYAKKYGELLSLSEQQGLDCDYVDDGCGGGCPVHVITALAKQGGSEKEEDYPYENIRNKCRTDKSKIVVNVTGGQVLKVDDEESLKDALYNYGPLSIALYMSESLHNYKHGVIKPQDCYDHQPDHALLLVGYGTEGDTPYWIIKNSWPTYWGENDYLRLYRGAGLCSITFCIATADVA